jgi:hypothetical protein
MLGLIEPHTFELPDQRLATVMTVGDPDSVGPEAIRVLYDTVGEVRKSTSFDLEPLRVRWPTDEQAVPRSQWGAMWGLPVPTSVEQVPQLDPKRPVRVEVWEYGTVAEILHEGGYAAAKQTLDKLKRYMDEQRYEVIGPHEEEYLTPPGSPSPRMLIRYRVRPR